MGPRASKRDISSNTVIRTLAGHKSSVKCVEFHPFGEFFASAASDSSIKLWDVRRKGCIQTYYGHVQDINVLKITPDGRWIASGGEDATVKVCPLDLDMGHDSRKDIAHHQSRLTNIINVI